MALGYRIMMQSDFSNIELELAKKYCDAFINTVAQNDGYWNKLTRAGWGDVAYGRGLLGDQVDRDGELYFRRISRGKRIFGVVRKNTLERLDGQPIEKKCRCKKCGGGQRVRFIQKPEMTVYYETGIIKG